MNIVLIGYRACGKSSVGKLLAQRLDLPFLDTDTLIEQRSGMTIRDIFADHAEQRFRELEKQVVAEVAHLNRHIISTGGGTVMCDANAAALKRSGLIVWLTSSPKMIWQRILTDTPRLSRRPQVDLDTGLEQIKDALAARNPVYQRWADHNVNTENLSSPQAVDEIVALLNDRDLKTR